MHLLFLIMATAGCTLLTLQIVLQLFGMDHGHGHAELHADGPHGDMAESAKFVGIFSVKSLSAFSAFFGLGGLAAEELGAGGASLVIASAGFAGVVAMAVVVLLMRGLNALQVSGTLKLEAAIGQPASVYLRIPGENAGSGKITVLIGQREVELHAMTAGPTIPTGARVDVIRQIDSHTFEVIALL